MARPKIPSQKKAYAALRGRINQYTLLVQQVYDQLNKEVASMVTRLGYDGSKPFSFSDYPQTSKAVRDLQEKFVGNLHSVIYTSTSREWKESNLLQDLLADKAMKFYGIKTRKGRIKKYYQTNSDALKAFQERKDKGLNLSQKLWNQSEDYKKELECAISSAVQKGTSAIALSKRLSKYLNDFPSLKADYGKRFGKARDVKDCEYRSIRLARTEINMAYRTAEQKRWEQFDFVIGYEVKLSGGHKIKDICDFAKGKYPKKFKFKGCHPNCFCYVIPILKSEDEFWDESGAPCPSEVVDIPDGFKDWLKDNKDRLRDAKKKGTLPYWAEENTDYVFEQKTHALRVADARHAARTDEDKKNILTRFENWRKMDEYDRDQYSKIDKWKDALGLDTSRLDKLMQTHFDGKGMDNEIWNEMIRLENKIDAYKRPFEDKIDELRERIYGKVLDEYGYNIFTRVKDKYDTVSKTLSPTANLADEMKKLNDLEKFINNFESGIVDLPNPSFIEDVFAGGASSVEEHKEILRYLVGTNKKNHYGLADLLDKFEKATDEFSVRDELQVMLKKDLGAVWDSIDNYSDLCAATDLKKIPKRWRLQFNKYIENIRAYDIELNGVAGVYNDIEGAYNIYKLSTMAETAEFGLSKVSPNCPHTLFKIWKKEGLPWDKFPSQTFFNYFDKFVPMYDGMVEVAENWIPTTSAHCNYKFNHVAISKKYFSQVNGRCKDNIYEAANVIYHEYGHAYDAYFPDGGWMRYKERFNNLFEKFEKRYNAMPEEDIRKRFWDAYDKVLDRRASKKIKNGSTAVIVDCELDEMMCACSDTIQSLRSDKLMINGGHGGNYFDNKYSRFAEFIAHMSENYWQGNEFFEEFDPVLYKEMKALMRVAYRGGKGALGKTKI